MHPEPESTLEEPLHPGPHPGDDELIRRLRVLLYARPLLQLRRNEAHREGHYDLLVLAMKIFDLVVENTGLEEEMTAERLVPRLAPTLRAMDEAAGVEADEVDHEEVVQSVLDWLRNERERRQPFQEDYLALEEGAAVRRTLEFRLMESHFQGEEITLRLTDPGVNLYLGALDVDIESAQAAAEAILESQIRRGKLESAVGTAKAARAQSIRYQQKIEKILQDTRQDVRRVDWRQSVPDLLEEAYEHTKLRQTAEQNILAATDERLDHIEPGGPDHRRLTEIAALVDECYQRHVGLQGTIMGARGVFLDAQEAQEFRPKKRGVLPDLHHDVLLPLMRMSAADASRFGERAIPRIMGPFAPHLFSLNTYLEWAMQPRREIGVAASRVEPRDLRDLSMDLIRFPQIVQDEGDRILRGLTEPVRLSDLLPSLDGNGSRAPLQEYVALRVLNLYAPDLDMTIPVDVERLDERFSACGLAGHDFLVAPVEVADG